MVRTQFLHSRRSTLRRLESEILIGREVGKALNPGGVGFVHALADAIELHVLIDGRMSRLLVEDPLDLVEERLALLPIELLRLALKELLDLRDDAIRIRPAACNVRLESCRRVPGRGRGSQNHPPEFLFAPS